MHLPGDYSITINDTAALLTGTPLQTKNIDALHHRHTVAVVLRMYKMYCSYFQGYSYVTSETSDVEEKRATVTQGHQGHLQVTHLEIYHNTFTTPANPGTQYPI